MSIEPYLISIYLSYALMVWFFIASVLSIKARSESKTVLTSLSLFFVWAFYSYILFNRDVLMDPLTSLQVYEMIFWFDLVTAAIMVMWLKDSKSLSFIRTLPEYLRYDTLAWMYAIILLLTAFCHFVMLDDVMLLLKAPTSYTPSIIYVWYDELLILGQLAQMAVAGYGMVKSIRILNVLHQTDLDYSAGVNDYIEGVQRQKEREA